MPELPETETIARDLAGAVVGLRITECAVLRRDVLRVPRGRDIKTDTTGRSIIAVLRRAKTIVVELDSGSRLLVTPRFTGALQFDVPEDPYLTIRWGLSGGHTLTYRDVRRLGTVALVDPAGYERFQASLGPEPIGDAFTREVLSGILRGSRSPIKKILMTPSRLAGVGNIYANEALWMAGIDPSRPAGGISAEESERLATALRQVLAAAIAARGTSFRDYRDASNRKGGFAEQLQAYGRGGEPCARCATRLTETHAIDGRSTVFCHRCQR